jgi:hypothetical protein
MDWSEIEAAWEEFGAVCRTHLETIAGKREHLARVLREVGFSQQKAERTIATFESRFREIKQVKFSE